MKKDWVICMGFTGDRVSKLEIMNFGTVATMMIH